MHKECAVDWALLGRRVHERYRQQAAELQRRCLVWAAAAEGTKQSDVQAPASAEAVAELRRLFKSFTRKM